MKRVFLHRLIYLVIMLAVAAVVIFWLAPQYIDLIDSASTDTP